MSTNTRWAAVIAGLCAAVMLSACITTPPRPTATATPPPSATPTSSPTPTVASTPIPAATRTPVLTETPEEEGTPFLQSGVAIGSLSFGITVVDQKITTGTVTVATVVGPTAVWVVVQQDSGGQPGNAIGQTLVNKGITQKILVKIDKTKATPILWIVLHKDEGKKGIFEFPGPDVPVLDTHNQPIQKSFKVLAK